MLFALTGLLAYARHRPTENPLLQGGIIVKANYFLTSMDREVAAVSEAMLSFTDAGGL